MKKIYLTLSFICLLVLPSIGQLSLSGIVKDKSSQESLIGATIVYNDSNYTSTDENGFFSIQMDSFFNIKVQYVGYISYFKNLEFGDSDTLELLIELDAESSILTTLVVTGSNYEKNIIDEPTSIEVIKPLYLQNNNINSLENRHAACAGSTSIWWSSKYSE